MVTSTAAIELLETIRQELGDIHRGKHFAQWRPDAVQRLESGLSALPPFDAYAETRIFSGDGGSLIASTRFGDWAVDRLVAGEMPDAILAALHDETARNSATYLDVSPIFGVDIDAECELADGIRIVPASEVSPWWEPHPIHRWMALPNLPTGTSYLAQTYRVEPAFDTRTQRAVNDKTGATSPAATDRDNIRQQVRLACLLAGTGEVALPISMQVPDRRSLFVGGDGNIASRPIAAYPVVSFPTEAASVKLAFDQLASFADSESLVRAIDRLGRARMARSPVDQALELGIAAEIALMHGDSSSNTETTHKIGSRAAWLLGDDAEARAAIFGDIKALYHARSKAVHEGTLPKKSKVDLNDADKLVAQILKAIAARGRFPDWSNLTMGGVG
ncbi:HEPN domain-containing protein [Sphingomonas sp. PAMC 26617]|uniref:HEPN domain-containing protein n=1 Tax=Sphingomonas sp. PAMC 26617 TaxID=1112216 RepID=UPI00028852E2|nr:HEPN domain-containing protein [Sphingomonas sp. PAMC 26617]